jgi:hypothetical protein
MQSYRGGISRTHLTMQVCSRVNPFCREALGAKIPDESAGYTVPFQSRFFIGLSSDVNGNGATYIQPYPASCYTVPLSIAVATGIVTWSAASNSPDYGALSGQFRDMRIVSWGVRSLATQAWTSAQGITIISSVQTTPTADTAAAVAVGAMNNGTDVQTYALRDLDAAFIGKPTDHMWTAFQSVTTIGPEDTTSVPWSQYLITIQQGTPSVVPINLEIVVNLEGRAFTGNVTIMNQLATAPVRSNPPLAQIIDSVRQKIPTTIKSTSSTSIDSSIWNLATETMKTMGPQMLNAAMMFL